ncbi:uncharacterized protein KRP23_9490 [Phytophthora ramorum]|uniref:uncharacterized protein n=1 Tax=Phytophthora ramorum TaxID=164328 RepID=UPI00309EF839|nr:hypothetical protein KRP23_9490 [Phytophthora ramorum]
MATSSKASVAFIMNSSENVPVPDQEVSTPAARSRQARSPATEEKRRARECKVDGCENYIINKRLCFRHGGGKKCAAEGCRSSAKHAGLCWKHGKITTRL